MPPVPTPALPDPPPGVWTTLSAPVYPGDTAIPVVSTDGFALGNPIVLSGGGNLESRTMIGVGFHEAFSRSWSWDWWSGRKLSQETVLVVNKGMDFSYMPGSLVYVPPVTPAPTYSTDAPTPAPTHLGDTWAPSPAPTLSPTPAPTFGARDSMVVSCAGQCEAVGPEGAVCSDTPLLTVTGKSEVGCMDECLDHGERCEYFAYSSVSETCILYETCTSYVQSDDGSTYHYNVFIIPLKATFIPAFYR